MNLEKKKEKAMRRKERLDGKRDFNRPKEKINVEFYLVVLDMAIESIEERFTQFQLYFSVSYMIFPVQKKPSHKILNCCETLKQSLNNGDSRDVDGSDLRCQLTAIARRLPKSVTPQDMLTFLVQQKLLDIMPKTLIALRILLTLPVIRSKRPATVF